MSALMLEHRDDLAWSVAHATNLPWQDLLRDRSLDPRLRDIIAAAIIEADTSEGAGT